MKQSIAPVLGRAVETIDEGLEQLRMLVAHPSISTRGEGIRDCVSTLRHVMGKAGIVTEVMETGGHPAVLGVVPGPADAPVVLFYGHYDVQPPEPLDLWTTPPFTATLRDGRIYGRGVADNKGQHLCHIRAVKAWQDVWTQLPVTVKFLIEGEEEIGSPHLAALVGSHREKLRADIVCIADGAGHASGRPFVSLGVRGLLYVEVEVRGARADAHSGRRGNLLPQPAWELVHLLASLRDSQGRVLIPGFYDRVRPPRPEDLALLDGLPFDRERFLGEHGLADSPIMDAREYHRRLAYEPTFNIAGLDSGYTQRGIKTIIPARALAKIDFRLVADQEPEEIFAKLVKAVAALNPRAEVRPLGAVPPSRTDPSLPICQAVLSAVRESSGAEPIVVPVLGGTLPAFVFTRVLGAPSLIIPYANHDENNHAPDENLRLDHFHAGIRTTIHILDTLGRLRTTLVDTKAVVRKTRRAEGDGYAYGVDD